MSDRDTAFAEHFAARSEPCAARLTCCADWHRAEDLVQATFAKPYVAWRRVQRHEALDAYTRRTLVRTFVSELRRGWFRKERVGALAADPAAVVAESAEDRLVLLAALGRLPPRQRAVVVLR